jgi:hypothetical protein
VIVVADRPPALVRPGEELSLDVHLVSDRREPSGTCRASARLSWTGGEHTWEWAGEIPADSCERIGSVTATVPDAPGPLTLDLDVVGTDRPVTNRYESTIVR